MKYKLILFDADGTIFDDDQPIVRAIKRGFVEKNLKAPSEETILKHSGYPIREWVELIAKDEGHNLPKEDLDEITNQAVRLLIGFFFKVLGKEMPGAKETINELNKQHATALITNATLTFTSKALQVLKMENLFSEVFTPENNLKPKPHPDMLLAAMKKFNAKPEETLMIGDSQVDVTAANTAKINCALLVNNRNKNVKGETQRITSLKQLIKIVKENVKKDKK